jgi:predicted nucleotidyltransferase
VNNTLPDICGKIDPAQVAVLRDVDACCSSLTISFFVVGAAARDILLESLYGIATIRATADTDFAVLLASWDQYTTLTASLCAGDRFRATQVVHRYRHASGRLVDFVPFGSIADANHTITWPGDGERMTVTGFAEVHASACAVRVAADPELIVRVATPAGLAVLKLISWDEKYPDRDNDAVDLRLIAENYLGCGTQDVLFEQHTDILDDPKFDYTTAGARLLGRHMARIMAGEARERVLAILRRESPPESALRLARQMVGVHAVADELETAAQMLGWVLRGVSETQGHV